jgi:hypothetical protein
MKISSSPDQIEVARPVLIDRATVRYELNCTSPIRKYLSSQSMFVTYDVDLSDVPDAILLIPLLSTVAPIVWALGAELYVPCLDVIFFEALSKIKQSFRLLHPGIDWSGEVRGNQIVDSSRIYQGSGHAILFSGGVDSLTSFVVHKQKKPRLVTVWGADLGLAQHRLWERVSTTNRAFAESRSMDISLIKTNFRTFFNSYILKAKFKSLEHFSNWYSGIQQGLGLLGLCAPLSYIHGLGSIYIPSTFAADFNQSWGSDPEIDNNVKWALTEAVHDGYDLSRQKKIQILAKYIREEDERLSLRVCWANDRNCSKCPKCCQTMLGLALEGLDPNNHGFCFSSATLSYIHERFEEGGFHLSDGEMWLWMDIQKHIGPRANKLKVEGLEEFFTWFQGASLEHFKEKSERSIHKAFYGFMVNRPEPIGKWFRKALGHPFP